MRERRELFGHGIEFAGFLIVFLAVLWQSTFSDWWKDQLDEWQSRIQEELIISLQYSVANLAALETEQDPKQRLELTRKISEGSIRAVEDAIIQRDKRSDEMKTGQAALFLNINTWLAMAGACLFAFGKWFTLAAAIDRAKKIEKDQE